VLRRLGYYDGPLDGAFGPGARTAIRRYQRETGMAPTGLLTPDQVRRLLSTQRAGAV
jgi:peptidoglycan hydrolase-like protein with peptidoglycan-binding domain